MNRQVSQHSSETILRASCTAIVTVMALMPVMASAISVDDSVRRQGQEAADANPPAVSKSVPKGWTEDFEAARRQASKDGKSLLVSFSGSDWCGWCVKMEKEVFAVEEFIKEASKKFVLVMIDSPHDESVLSKLARTQNADLKRRYNVNSYPTVIIVNPTDGSVINRLSGYRAGGPFAYMDILNGMSNKTAVASEAVVSPRQPTTTSAKPLDRMREKKLRQTECMKNLEAIVGDTPLEPRIKIDEALALARDGAARGFYQLAVAYAERVAGNEVEKDEKERLVKTSDDCLARAVDAGYANALLLHAIDVAHEKLFSLTHCGRHWHANCWHRCAGIYVCTFDGSDLEIDTAVESAVTNRSLVAEVLSEFDRASRAGVPLAGRVAAYITNNVVASVEGRIKKRLERGRENEDVDTAVAALLGRKAKSKVQGDTRASEGAGKEISGSRDARKGRTAGLFRKPLDHRQLEPLLPFADAVRKAKDGDGAGMYALALHYAGGMEIAQSPERAVKYLRKAADSGYGNAVLVNSLLGECELKDPRYPDDRGWHSSGIRFLNRNIGGQFGENARTDFSAYTGGIRASAFGFRTDASWNVTNELAVARVRFGYLQASKLGVTQATNELARFERWLAAQLEEIREEEKAERLWREKIGENERLAKQLLGEEPSTNAVFKRQMDMPGRKPLERPQGKDVRVLPSEIPEQAAERERQRRALIEIQEELRRARREKELARENGK